jgi:nucleoside-diphosphate-sugar epimerase
MRKVLISGANGFIGQNLAKILKEAGWKIIGTDINGRPGRHLDAFYKRRLLEPLGDVLNGGEWGAFVHCAYYTGKDEFRINVEGTKMWAEEAKQNAVPLQIFLSSISAHRDASAVYGKLKHETEKWFLKNDQVVLRLGMVIGNGGFFGRIVQTVQKWPVVPLISGGRYSVYFLGVESVCGAVRHMIDRQEILPRGVSWNIFQPKPTTLRGMMQTIKEEYGLRCTFLPVPYLAVLPAVVILERLPFLRVKINSNNIKGLKQYENLAIESDLLRLGFREIGLRELVAKSKESAASSL